MKHTFFAAAALTMAMSVSAAQNEKAPLMGWSSWNAYMVDISGDIIRHEADMLVKTGLRDLGYAQVNIDDGFFGPRSADGKMTVNPKRFPNGMRGVVDYIHSLKMTAGIYSDAGDNTCGSMYNKDPLGNGAGLYGHDVQDAQVYFNDWDFDFIKIDYCGGSHLKLDPEKRYKEIKKNIDATAHKPISINVCRWAYPGTWITEVGDSWRTTEDIRPNWKSVSKLVRMNLYLSAFCRDGHYNDMDMLALGYEGNQSGLGEWNDASAITKDFLNADEENAHFGLWCIMSSPLLIGCKLANIPQRSLALLKNKELIALNQDPLHKQAYVVQHEGDTYVLVKDLLKENGTTRAAALYNPSDRPVVVSVSARELGYKGKMAVRDLLLHKNLGKMERINLTVPAHGVQMLGLKGSRTETTCYEAEWAYLPQYSMIKYGPYTRAYEPASGRVVVDGLGGEGNDLVWENIYSEKGGSYELTLYTAPALGKSKTGSIVLNLNGTVVNPTAPGNIYKVALKKGKNVVTLSCPEAMPAVDCLVIKAKS